jgi:hypothetical protein
MNKLIAFGLLAFVLSINAGCEQQSYEETRMFNQSHKASGHGSHGSNHDAGKAGESHKETKH